ncbi:MAG: endonuclease III, partial [Candidatus Peribacteraceae bacterium]|nr:endonuclease III [Candidatus Peribacteraceae bacterium]
SEAAMKPLNIADGSMKTELRDLIALSVQTALRHVVPAAVIAPSRSDVNIVTKTLFRHFRKPEDYIAVSRKKLEAHIHSCGTFHAKAKYIQELCKILLAKHHGRVPRTVDELVHLPGVGRKTAAIVLYGAFNKNEGIATDTHVMRLARRLGLTRHKDQKKIERDLMELFPRKEWGRMNALFISHGRAVCTARNRKCEKCTFKKRCPSSLMLGKKDLGKR